MGIFSAHSWPRCEGHRAVRRVVALFLFQVVDVVLVPGVRIDLVVGDAGLEHVHQRIALVVDGLAINCVRCLGSLEKPRATNVAPAAIASAIGLTAGLDRPVRRGRGHVALLARGRVLALRQSVGLVVLDDVHDVQVATHGVDHMAHADAIPVAIARGDDHLQVMVGELEPSSDRGARVRARC